MYTEDRNGLFIIIIVSYWWDIYHTGAGFVLVTNIMESRIGKSLSINENDIRKVVAGSPRFTMNEDLKKPSKTKVRVNWQMQHGAREVTEDS